MSNAPRKRFTGTTRRIPPHTLYLPPLPSEAVHSLILLSLNPPTIPAPIPPTHLPLGAGKSETVMSRNLRPKVAPKMTIKSLGGRAEGRRRGEWREGLRLPYDAPSSSLRDTNVGLQAHDAFPSYLLHSSQKFAYSIPPSLLPSLSLYAVLTKSLGPATAVA